MSYRRFQLPARSVATVAGVKPQSRFFERPHAPETVASVATVARAEPETSNSSAGQTVANVASVAAPEPRTRILPFRQSAARAKPERHLREVALDPVARPDDAEVYAEALRLHGPASYGMMMRVLGWGGMRAGQAETALRIAGRIAFNKLGRAVLHESNPQSNSPANP